MKPLSMLAVVIGAGIGGGLRYALGGWMTARWGAAFPWHTMAINLGGAFLLGLLMALSVDRGMVSSDMRLFLGVGVLGGFTTFSTLAFESVALMESGLVSQGILNMAGSAVLGILAAIAGILVGRWI